MIFFRSNIINDCFNFLSVSFSVTTSRCGKLKSMNYKAFAEFLNHSREAKDLLDTNYLLGDQTGDRLQTNGGYRGPGDKLRIGNEGNDSTTNISFGACSFSDYLDRFENHI